MFKAFFLSLLISSSSFANYSYFHFKKDQVKVQKSSFYRYIRPQARNIVTEYYHLLKKLNPFHTELLKVKTLLDKQNELLTNNCQSNDTDECQKTFAQMHRNAKELDLVLLKIQQMPLEKKSIKEQRQKDSLLKTQDIVDEVALLNYRVVHLFEENMITSKTIYENYSHVLDKVAPTLRIMNIKMMMTYTTLLKSSYKDDFENCLINFIDHLDKKVVKAKDFDYLLNNLEKLNITWNSFHMKMEKGNREIGRKQVQTIKIMHNRWNSILKMILRR